MSFETEHSGCRWITIRPKVPERKLSQNMGHVLSSEAAAFSYDSYKIVAPVARRMKLDCAVFLNLDRDLKRQSETLRGAIGSGVVHMEAARKHCFAMQKQIPVCGPGKIRP